LCSGTETRSATAIVSAGIQVLVKRGAHFLFATHLHEISELEIIRKLDQVKFAHLGVEYSDNQIKYNRNLQSGPGKSLYGLEVCYGLDMDEEFLALATSSRDSKTSKYNSKVEIRKCEVCGSTNRLETHHIIEQSCAINGFIDNDVSKNRPSNLTVLCDFCHKEHHAKRIVIQGWKDTSQGRQLEISKNTETPEQDMNLIFERVKNLIKHKKREKDIIANVVAEFKYKLSINELRQFKRENF
jgi:DNA mismatch repair protein MutS